MHVQNIIILLETLYVNYTETHGETLLLPQFLNLLRKGLIFFQFTINTPTKLKEMTREKK